MTLSSRSCEFSSRPAEKAWLQSEQRQATGFPSIFSVTTNWAICLASHMLDADFLRRVCRGVAENLNHKVTKEHEGHLRFWILDEAQERIFPIPKEAAFGLGSACPQESVPADKGAPYCGPPRSPCSATSRKFRVSQPHQRGGV